MKMVISFIFIRLFFFGKVYGVVGHVDHRFDCEICVGRVFYWQVRLRYLALGVLDEH